LTDWPEQICGDTHDLQQVARLAAACNEAGSRAMCEKCDDIDAKIIRYKRLASQINDKILNDGIAQLIEKVLAEKASLHPEPDKK
jgi:hypothetical protein